MLDFLEFFQAKHPKIKAKVHVDNSLHGKIYVFTNNHEHQAIITSANFTNNGLKHNHEWGVLSPHSEQIENLVDEIFEAIEFKELTLTQLRKAIMFADQYAMQKHGIQNNRKLTSISCHKFIHQIVTLIKNHFTFLSQLVPVMSPYYLRSARFLRSPSEPPLFKEKAKRCDERRYRHHNWCGFRLTTQLL